MLADTQGPTCNAIDGHLSYTPICTLDGPQASMNKKIAIIIGAGPAGLTAAYELLQKSNITPIVFESSDDLGGLAKTVNYKGNRIDIGGHRFFSKSDRVMEWWNNILPLQAKPP